MLRRPAVSPRAQQFLSAPLQPATPALRSPAASPAPPIARAGDVGAAPGWPGGTGSVRSRSPAAPRGFVSCRSFTARTVSRRESVARQAPGSAGTLDSRVLWIYPGPFLAAAHLAPVSHPQVFGSPSLHFRPPCSLSFVPPAVPLASIFTFSGLVSPLSCCLSVFLLVAESVSDFHFPNQSILPQLPRRGPPAGLGESSSGTTKDPKSSSSLLESLAGVTHPHLQGQRGRERWRERPSVSARLPEGAGVSSG